VGAEQDALEADARLAECALLAGIPEEALLRADGALARARTLTGGTPASGPALQRIRGWALMLMSDHPGARRALEESLTSARARRSDFDVALTLRARARL